MKDPITSSATVVFLIFLFLYDVKGLSSTTETSQKKSRAFQKESQRSSNKNLEISGDAKHASVNQVIQSFQGCARAVVVKRGKQSRAFRDGNPLVFSGAVDFTVDVDTIDNTERRQKDGLKSGDIVAVVVGSKSSSSSSDSSRSRGRKSATKSSHDDAKHYYCLSTNTSGDASNGNGNSGIPSKDILGAQLIGFGVYNTDSMYRVRILCHETSHPTLFQSLKQMFAQGDDGVSHRAIQMILENKIQGAITARTVLGLPSTSTDSFRLVNGEGDGLSGLAIDILSSNVAVVMSSASWCETYKQEILNTLTQLLGKNYSTKNMEIVWRTTDSRLKQDGHTIRNDDDDVNNSDNNNRSIIALESNIKYKLYPWSNGQKTGFYCDQRDNRIQIAQLANNKRVLDLCCYNGGFSLAAAKNGALLCVGVDSSQDAIESARENATINSLESVVSFVRDDIAVYLKEAYERGEEYDIIILDPPKLAPSVAALERASRKYHALNRDAMKLINKKNGGLLLTCTCSGAMTQEKGGLFFMQTVSRASISANRDIRLLRTSGAASCHVQAPAAYPAGAYLTAALFQVGATHET